MVSGRKKKQSREMFKRAEMWEFGDQIDAERGESKGELLVSRLGRGGNAGCN